MMKKAFLSALFAILLFVGGTQPAFAQTVTLGPTLTSTPSATPSVAEKKDVTKPETKTDREKMMELFAKDRSLKGLNIFNFTAFGVQYAVHEGVPANTIILILLLPLLATVVVFFRYIIGWSGLGILVPIALSITLLSTGLGTGFILLATILLASFVARLILKRIRIMQLPKLALSMMLVAVTIVVVLTFATTSKIFNVQDISIFPILLLVLLSDRVVALFLERSLREVITITSVTLILGVIGYFMLSWSLLRTIVVLYPEIILLVIPVNILMGRYFGLRVTEYVRFRPIREYGSH